jgi:hypothetical protein
MNYGSISSNHRSSIINLNRGSSKRFQKIKIWELLKVWVKCSNHKRQGHTPTMEWRNYFYPKFGRLK